MRFIWLMVMNSFCGLTVFAGQTICEDQFEKRLRYSIETPDGGAPGPVRERLVLDKKVLIDSPSLGGKPEGQNAVIEIKAPKEQYTMKTANGLYRHHSYSANAVVKLADAESILFDNIVLCRTSRYTGAPAP